MIDSAIATEEARRRDRLSQKEIADLLEITQGHYSKVIRGLVPLSTTLDGSMKAWLESKGHPVTVDAKSVRMRKLAASIQAQCIELMHLANLVEDETQDTNPPIGEADRP